MDKKKYKNAKIKSSNTLENLKELDIIKGIKDTDFTQSNSNTKQGFKYYAYENNSDKYIAYRKFVSRKDFFEDNYRLVLQCSMFTTKDEISSFLQRAFFDASKTQYFCIDLDLMSKPNFNHFLS